MSYYYRAAPAVIDKVDGNENQSFEHHPAKVYKDATDFDHEGKPLGVITYQDGELHCRITAQNRDWHFRGLELGTLQDQVRKFFGVARGRIKFRLDRAADLARHGEHNAIGRL